MIAAINTLPIDHRLRRWNDPLLRVWDLPEEDKGELLAAIDKMQGQIAAVLHYVEPRLQPCKLGELAAMFQTETHIARVGQARKAGRPLKPENSNDALIERLRIRFRDLFTAPVTVGRIAIFQDWLRTQSDLRYRDDETLARAIRRAKQKARRSK